MEISKLIPQNELLLQNSESHVSFSFSNSVRIKIHALYEQLLQLDAKEIQHH